jgi:hypothetical protein
MSFIWLFYSLTANAKVLVLVETVYHNENPFYVSQYVNDLKNIEFKNADVQNVTLSLYQNTYNQCHPIWQTICDEYTSSLSSGDTLEGVVMVGEIPSAWCNANKYGNNVPDDRYFMDICDQNHNVYSSDTPTVWSFDNTKNMFTSYNLPDQDKYLDVWVSRIMANQIRGLRDSLTVMDGYTIVNNYFVRLHARMTQPALVPPRGFAMGGISEWGSPDPVYEVGFQYLNLRNVYDIGFPDNRPANWLLQLVWGPYGGTTLGAFNGTRYIDMIGQNHITKAYSQLWDYKTGNWGQIQTNPPDTLGYEWAGIYEHSSFNMHTFNQDQENQTPFGVFRDVTEVPQWTLGCYNDTSTDYWNNWTFRYNPAWLSNPYDAICSRDEKSIFKAKVLGGSYRIYVHYPADTGNSNFVYGFIHSWPVNYNFGGAEGSGITRVFGFGSTLSCPLSYPQNCSLPVLVPIDMTRHIHTLPAPDNNFECIVDTSGNPGIFTFNDGDTAWIQLMVDGSTLIADAVRLVRTTDSLTTYYTIDNADFSFASNNWYERAFLDMQDEDMAHHNSISKVPFFVSSGCETGNYMDCYNPDDIFETLETSPYIENCLGVLYGMAHSGLISLTSASEYTGGDNSFNYFTQTLAGKDKFGLPNDFGNALLAKCNNDVINNTPMELIGAGTLRADSTAYVPYGTQEVMLDSQQVSTTVTYSDSGKLVWLQDLTVTSTGNLTVLGKEIRIFAESDLQGTVDIKVP